MPVVKIHADDLAQGQPLPEGWYPATVQSIKEEMASDKASVNYVTDFDIDNKGRSRIVKNWYNSKGLGYMAPLYAAATKTPIQTGKDLEFNTDDIVGKKLQVHVTTGVYKGNINNKIDNYLPEGVEVPF